MKIGTQLTAGAIAIGSAVALNLGAVLIQSSEEDAKVINQSGVVRGGTQRAIKLELYRSFNQDLIIKLDNLIESLINGNEELELKRATNPNYLAAMEEVQREWENIKKIIQQLRNDPLNNKKIAELVEESEKLFELTDAAVGAAEEYTAENVQRL